jgi:hypothetical protein
MMTDTELQDCGRRARRIAVPTLISYPAIYVAASTKSASAQRRLIAATRIRLISLVIAAIGGAFVWTVGNADIFGWLAMLAFITALATESYLLAARPDLLWYEGRAAAESAKTLAWRYAVGGDPFPASLSSVEVDDLLLARLREVLTDLDHLAVPPPASDGAEITNEMRKLRLSSFDDRRGAYCEGRIVDQQNWYGAQARWNDWAAHFYLWLMIAIEFAGLVAASLKAFAVLSVDLLGILGAAAAGLAAWTQVRQYGFNSRAYSIASHELASIRSVVRQIVEKDWSRFVEQSEEAISREHTLWRASKGVPPRNRRRGRGD